MASLDVGTVCTGEVCGGQRSELKVVGLGRWQLDGCGVVARYNTGLRGCVGGLCGRVMVARGDGLRRTVEDGECHVLNDVLRN